MKRFIGTKEFYLAVISIAMPIIAQQFVTSFVNLIDNIMIGSVGSIALSAVTVSNRVYLIFNSTLFGLCGGAGIFIAQHFGANNKDRCQKILNINITCALVSALLFISLLLLIPEPLIRIFTDDSKVIQQGLLYIKYVIFAYLPYAFSYSVMMALRAVGINKIQLVIGIIGVCTNTCLNYLLIFGKFGFPMLGIQGAAIATAIARMLEMIIYIVLLIKHKHYFVLDIKGLLHLDIKLIQSMIRKAIPLALNEILFSLALAVIFLSYTRCDQTLIPALSVVDTVMQIAYIIFSGLSSAVSILIGNKLGAGKLEEAKDNSLKLIAFGMFIALFITLTLYMCAPFVAEMYNVELVIKETIVTLIRIKSFILPVYVYNVCIFFILRAGGDALSTLIMDSGFLWCFNVTLSTIISIYFNVPLVYLYAFIESIDVFKMMLATYFYKKGKWIKNITELNA